MQPKPGFTSSEFLLVGLGVVAFVLNGTEFVNIPWDQFPWLAGIIAAYTGGRSWVKSTREKAGTNAT